MTESCRRLLTAFWKHIQNTPVSKIKFWNSFSLFFMERCGAMYAFPSCFSFNIFLKYGSSLPGYFLNEQKGFYFIVFLITEQWCSHLPSSKMFISESNSKSPKKMEEPAPVVMDTGFMSNFQKQIFQKWNNLCNAKHNYLKTQNIAPNNWNHELYYDWFSG